MISGSHAWSGFAGLNFAGFVDTFTMDPLDGSPGQGQFEASGSWSSSGKWSAGGFAVGDLVVVAIGIGTPGGFNQTNFGNLSSVATVYCPCKCIVALDNSGTPTNPMTDSTHWTPWDFNVVGAAEASTPTDWSAVIGIRSVGEDSSASAAFLNLTITDEFSNFPPIAPGGSPPFTFGGAYLSDIENAADATFTRTWTINQYTGNVSTSSTGGTPSSAQSDLMFPFVPTALGIAMGSNNAGSQVTNKFSFLTAWAFSANSVSFTFAVWPNEGWPGMPGSPTPWGALPAASTITQTIAVSGEYDLSNAISDCAALLGGTSFAAMSWRTKATCAYDAGGSGSINVATSALASTANANTTCGGSPASAATGYASNSITGGVNISMSTALVDVCGPYCTRTYHCTAATPVVDCASGTVDGYAPVTIPTPAIPSGETAVQTYLFPNCQCP
jgi:hypothetical protein